MSPVKIITTRNKKKKPKIIFNYNLCDMAPECGGIEICPTGAIYYDEKLSRPAWNESKCTFCLKCTTPDACPVGAILFARDQAEEKKIMKMIRENPETQKLLWRERYGVQPARFSPIATVVDDSYFNKMITDPGFKIVDIWSEETLDCRLHSPLYEDLLRETSADVGLYKLDAGTFPELANKLKVKKFPTLLLLNNTKEVYRYSSYINDKEIETVRSAISKYIHKSTER